MFSLKNYVIQGKETAYQSNSHLYLFIYSYSLSASDSPWSPAFCGAQSEGHVKILACGPLPSHLTPEAASQLRKGHMQAVGTPVSLSMLPPHPLAEV